MPIQASNSKKNIKAKRILDAVKEVSASFKNVMFGNMYVYAIEQKLEKGNDNYLRFMQEFWQPPVDIETFLDSDDFLGSTDLVLWPEVRKAIISINKDWWKGPEYAVEEALLMGATSSGKSEIAKISFAYHLHILGCLKNPQSIYGLPKATSIVFIIQAAKPNVIKKILYLPLRSYIESMPWFQRYLRPNKLIESEIYFDKLNVRVVPGGTDSDSVLGEAIIGGIIDEINFMNIVQQSKKAAEGVGRSNVYDQAQSVYDTISRRRKGRFLYNGPQVGAIFVSSSTRYKGDFTDRRKQQVLDLGEKNVFIYDKAQYEAKPADRYCGETFRVVIENEAASDIRIIEDNSIELHELSSVFEVPIEYLSDFQKDPSGSLRDIVGKSASSINPFFKRKFKIMEAVQRGEENGLESFVHNDNVILGVEGLPTIKRGHYCKNPGKPRYVHIDLSVTGDRCGIAMVCFEGLVEKLRGGGSIEYLPKASIELAITITPDHGNEIDLAEIRTWVKHLRTLYGYPVKVVTYDGWNSLESRQQWRKQGMITGQVSVDRSSIPYKTLRDAYNDDRIYMYNQSVLVEELFDLEYDEKKDKIDHPHKGSKDCADAVCAAYYTLIKRSATWVMSSEDRNVVDNRIDFEDRFDDERPV